MLFSSFFGSDFGFFGSFFSHFFCSLSGDFGCDGGGVSSDFSGLFCNVCSFGSDGCIFGHFGDFSSDSGFNSSFFGHCSGRSGFHGDISGICSHISGNFSRSGVEVCSGFRFGNGRCCASGKHSHRCNGTGDKFDVHGFTLSET